MTMREERDRGEGKGEEGRSCRGQRDKVGNERGSQTRDRQTGGKSGEGDRRRQKEMQVIWMMGNGQSKRNRTLRGRCPSCWTLGSVGGGRGGQSGGNESLSEGSQISEGHGGLLLLEPTVFAILFHPPQLLHGDSEVPLKIAQATCTAAWKLLPGASLI